MAYWQSKPYVGSGSICPQARSDARKITPPATCRRHAQVHDLRGLLAPAARFSPEPPRASFNGPAQQIDPLPIRFALRTPCFNRCIITVASQPLPLAPRRLMCFHRFLRVVVVAPTVFLLPPALAASQDGTEPPAYVAYVDGTVTLEREAVAEPATTGVPFLPGDRLLSTTGRAEVLFPDGSTLHVDEYSSVELLGRALLRLTDGRILLLVAGVEDPSRAIRFQVDTPVASAATDGPGEFRLSLRATPVGVDTEFAVIRGWGALSTDRGSTALVSGQRSVASDGRIPSSPQAFNSARFDAFDRWSEARRSERMGTTSASYLPDDLQMYGGVFDRYGSWQYDGTYGNVWYPSVAPDWRPYYYGYWSSLPVYGWTWIGHDAWGWPTHHYGRWGYARSRWFWMPNRTWAPAWVTWASAPGYVGWCPLGFDNRPVFTLSATFGGAWTGWTVVPRANFGAPHAYAHASAIAPPRLPQTTHFAAQAVAPVAPRAQPRSSASIGGASAFSPRGSNRRAVPRSADAGQVPQVTDGANRTSLARRAVPRTAAGVAASAETVPPLETRPTEAPLMGDFRRPATPAGQLRRAPVQTTTSGAPETQRRVVGRGLTSATPVSPAPVDPNLRSLNPETPSNRQAQPRWGRPVEGPPPAQVAPPSMRAAQPSARRGGRSDARGDANAERPAPPASPPPAAAPPRSGIGASPRSSAREAGPGSTSRAQAPASGSPSQRGASARRR